MYEMNEVELATVLAALRYYQKGLETNGGSPPCDVDEVATDGGTLDALSTYEIEDLCERLNFGGH